MEEEKASNSFFLRVRVCVSRLLVASCYCYCWSLVAASREREALRAEAYCRAEKSFVFSENTLTPPLTEDWSLNRTGLKILILYGRTECRRTVTWLKLFSNSNKHVSVLLYTYVVPPLQNLPGLVPNGPWHISHSLAKPLLALCLIYSSEKVEEFGSIARFNRASSRIWWEDA
jgi:hypothetical protein